MEMRDQILKRVRAASSDAVGDTRGFRHVRPRVNGKLIKRFVERVELSVATVEICPRGGLVTRVRAYCESHGIEPSAAAAPELIDVAEWGEFNVRFGSTEGDDVLGVNLATAGIAETGTLVMPSRPGAPANLNFLPDYEIVVLHEADIVKRMEDVWSALGADMPRVVNLVTGPSRTADVEQTIQLGAHGPRELHVIIIAAPAA